MINKDMMQDVYSTKEVKTNKVWIDGKPIYRKVIANNVSCGPSTTISLSNIGIDTLLFNSINNKDIETNLKRVYNWNEVYDYVNLHKSS